MKMDDDSGVAPFKRKSSHSLWLISIVKTNKEGATDEKDIKTLIHQIKVRREAAGTAIEHGHL